MSSLPAGWRDVPLAEVCDIVRGITFPAAAKQTAKSATNVGCLRTSNLQHELLWDDVYFVPAEYVKRADQLVRAGDILMSMANSSELVGKVALARAIPYAAAFGAFLSAVRPRDSLVAQYLFHYLQTDPVQQQLRAGASQTTNLANISVGTVGRIRIPLAPIAEQQRIADQLDALRARADSCRQRLDRVATMLARFRESVFAAATRGELTRDFRSAHGLATAPWPACQLRDLTRLITKGASPRWQGFSYVAERSRGVLFVTSENVRALQVDLTAPKYVDAAFSDSQRRSVLNRGDLLTNIVGASIGRSALFDSDERANINQAVCLIRLKEGVEPRFILYTLSSPALIAHLHGKKVDVARANLSLADIGNLPIALPAAAEQTAIVRRVDSLLAAASQLEGRCRALRAITERIIPAALAKAFRGELVSRGL